ncbi:MULTISPECIES: bis(5'-nucleosyl)-tetraphosphatase [unclassified Methanoculleus]|jgi:8-oxo-dGTP pyrophosphatase MutT (NUDIX family)|uniref:Bis(5'-nucleosyl)-tetraphosphatase [asymmetrical] n=1 Tax=Methanoculleus palmolei TaxID=72612 RepID=A0ABD8AB56_9EURY|nr:NUDIX domain-containing protein [Methanoculleus sp. UBA377]WOX56297.1 NUDIX domain-containing protein [Methanoculleus palmolei]
MTRERSCGAVVFRRDTDLQYLLLQYGAGHWDLVKGHGKRGESEEETVLRELAEETGITRAAFIPGFREEIHYFFQRRGRTVYKEVVYYLIETPEKEVTLSDEHVAYRWLPHDEALRVITFGNSKKVVDKAHAYLTALQNQKRG